MYTKYGLSEVWKKRQTLGKCGEHFRGWWMKYKIQKGVSYEFGALAVKEGGINFCIAASGCRTLFLCIYDEKGSLLVRADLLKYHAFGNVYSVLVGIDASRELYYTVEKDGKIFIDPYLKNVKRIRKWGEVRRKGHIDPATLLPLGYDWEDDRPLKLDFSEVIAYELHVRGFTKDASSKVAHRGTFLGLVEKLDYIKDLGITQLVLLPAYFFYEFDAEYSLRYQDVIYNSDSSEKESARMNFWGFKNANYFMPKPEYSSSNDFVTEFKDMVKTFHKAGIEIVMRFYFPDSVNRNVVVSCLEYWVKEYHIDGFFLMGENLPMRLIASNDVLFDTKIYYSYFNEGELPRDNLNPRLAVCGRDYMNVARRYLKSDEDMLNAFLKAQNENPALIHRINYITSYEGFTLNDLVSYDYKHNEPNGEGNRDGENYNYSWNCGAEGPSRKKQIQSLRMKQMKNILLMLLSARGVPMLLAGDEFMNSQSGNNNPYCQDNHISWLNWRDTSSSRELYEYVKGLIAFRKAHPIVHMLHEPKMLDSLSCGYPDLSYHAEQAWYPKLYNHIRHIGMMFCGKYAKRPDGKDDDFIYIAYNMHWESHEFALPKLPKGFKWEAELSSEAGGVQAVNAGLFEKQENVIVAQRSVLVLRSVQGLD
ncbi:MAG: hypothetical protein IJT16_00905 [Lachnospiraceae bacterium]|nr:hypothetical protein [Lachnospiraceae bacterium]